MGGKKRPWALRWATGGGKQSGLYALSAAAVVGLAFIDLIRPDCGGSTSCAASWDRLLFVPRVLMVPAGAAALVLLGSWWAQHRHARTEKRFFTQLEQEQADRPPGHYRPEVLDQDLRKRTLRGMGLGALAAAGALLALAPTRLALRSCDPWTFKEPTGLQVCSSASDWADMTIAFEVWGMLIATALMGLWWSIQAFKVRVGDLGGPGPAGAAA